MTNIRFSSQVSQSPAPVGPAAVSPAARSDTGGGCERGVRGAHLGPIRRPPCSTPCRSSCPRGSAPSTPARTPRPPRPPAGAGPAAAGATAPAAGPPGRPCGPDQHPGPGPEQHLHLWTEAPGAGPLRALPLPPSFPLRGAPRLNEILAGSPSHGLSSELQFAPWGRGGVGGRSQQLQRISSRARQPTPALPNEQRRSTGERAGPWPFS